MISCLRKPSSGRSSLAILALTSLIGVGFVQTEGPTSQMQAPKLESLVNIRLQSDSRLFTVMAALNLAGFDDETPNREMSEIRSAVREELKSLDPELRQRLEAFYKGHLSQAADPGRPQVPYTSLALLLSPPPELKLSEEEATMTVDVLRVRGFETLVQEFYRKAGIERLWQRHRRRYDEELQAYRPILEDVVRRTLQYFRIPARIVLDRQIILIADLLDVKGIVNARNMERVYYIVVGPVDDPAENRRQIEHEYLHFLVDPLIQKHGATLLKYENLLDVAQNQPHIRTDFQNKFLLVVTESLIECLQMRITPEERGESADRRLVGLFRKGLILAPHFHRGLEDYEKGNVISLPTYLETLFTGITESSIKEDRKSIALQERAMVEADQKAAAKEREERERFERRRRIQSLFDEATTFLKQRDFEKSRAKLEQVLELDSENSNAFFYLAQIHFQTGGHLEAFQYYERCASSAQVLPWIRARALLRMGRILASQQKYEQARELFEQVMEIEDDPQQKGPVETGDRLGEARRDAAELLKLLPPK